MKSLLIIDTPKTCKECPCQLMLVCVPADEDIDEYINPSETKPDWCPLRPLPIDLLKIEGKWIYKDRTEKAINNSEYVDGWNDCLKEIEG